MKRGKKSIYEYGCNNANLLKVRFIVNFNLGDERIVLTSIVINIESCFE